MGSVNKVILLGRLGADPEVRYTQDQTPVASFNIATSINYKNKSGEKVDKTSWHRCVCLLYTSPSPRDRVLSRMPTSA